MSRDGLSPTWLRASAVVPAIVVGAARLPARAPAGTVPPLVHHTRGRRMGVLVVLEMDGDPEAEHGEALKASGVLDAVTEMRSRVFEDAELSLGEPSRPATA